VPLAQVVQAASAIQAHEYTCAYMCAMLSGEAQVLATEPVLTLTTGPNSLPMYAKSSACMRQLLKVPPGLSPPGLTLLDGTRERHPLRSSSRPHLQAQPSVENAGADSSDPEVSSNCSTTDTVPRDCQASTSSLSELSKKNNCTAADSSPRCVLNLDIAVPKLAPLGSSERPSVGSSGHHLGICKPCAHVFGKQGCHNGPLCNFCHLCGPDDIKMHKKKKQAFQCATKR